MLKSTTTRRLRSWGWAAAIALILSPLGFSFAAVDVHRDLRTHAPQPSAYKNALLLTAGVAKATTIPSDRNLVLITYDGGVLLMQNSGAAAAPIADVTDGTGPEIILPGSTRAVTPGGSLSFLNTKQDCLLTLSYYTAAVGP